MDLDNILKEIKENSKTLFVWSGENVPENFQEIIEKIQERAGSGKVCVEHAERLSLADYSASTFDIILSNIIGSGNFNHDSKAFANYLKLLKPKGLFICRDTKEYKDLESELKINGFQNFRLNYGSFFSAEKPNFEVGSVIKLKFTNKNKDQNSIAPSTKKVWQLDDDETGEADLINTDELLDESDLKKPDLSKYDCGTSDAKTGKRKACKNCSCGLAQELESETANEIKEKQKTSAASACGSCYLGDAFRCASCPYLGMPAFKPGEKVQLTEKLLKADE